MHSRPAVLIGLAVFCAAVALWQWNARDLPLAQTAPTGEEPVQITDTAKPADPAVKASTAPGAKPSPASTAIESDAAMDLLMQTDTNPEYPTFGDRLQEVMARRDGQIAIDPRALWQAAQQKNAWTATDAPAEALALTDDEKYDGREFIRINPLKIESLLPGDRMEIAIGQINQTYTARIDQVESHSNGSNVTWQGHLEGYEGDNQVVFSRGDSLIVAGITTPEGHFALEARGEHGWIAGSATLFKGEDQHIEVPEDALSNPTTSQPSQDHGSQDQPPML